MQKDGARLSKLKEVFKRAVQEILKEEDAVKSLLLSPQTKDSFYSDSIVQLTQEDIRNLFFQIKNHFGEIFKEKIRKNNLDTLLNGLDRDIKESRMCYKDIRDVEYIREIFESHIVDKKEDLVKYLEESIEEIDSRSTQIEEEIKEIKRQIDECKKENEESEQIYQKIVSELEAVCNE